MQEAIGRDEIGQAQHREEQMSGRYAYSINGEEYTGLYATRDQALEAGLQVAANHSLSPQTVFVGRLAVREPRTCGHARAVLAAMIGERPSAEVSAARLKDLDAALQRTLVSWLAQNPPAGAAGRIEAVSEHPVPTKSIGAAAGRNGENSEVHDLGVGETQAMFN
jgi:hypothetical protein